MVDIASHARHDRFAIAAVLGGGALPSTVRTCPSCGALHDDLLSIQCAIRQEWTPRRPRDLRLGRGDRAGAHRTLWWRLADALASSRDAVARPAALGLTSLGIAGLVLANVTLGVGDAFGPGGMSAPASPEIGDHASAPYGGTPPASVGVTLTPRLDPLVIVSGASLAVGGTMLGLRRVVSRRRAVR